MSVAANVALWFARDVSDSARDGGNVARPNESSTPDRSASGIATDVAPAHRALVERMQAGDERAFAELMAEQWQPLWRYAVRMIHDSAAAADLVQDVFFDLWRRRAHVDASRGVRAYLFGATRFRALKHRRHQHIVERIEAQHDAPVVSGTAAIAPSADAPLDEGELAAALERVIATLPERRREVLVLRWWHGLTYDEIADILGLGVSAVKMQVLRAATQLKPLLEREFKPR